MMASVASFALLLVARQEQPKPDFPGELKTLVEEYRKAEREFYRPWREAKNDEERRKVQLDHSKHPAGAFIAKFNDLARRAKGTETGARALVRVLEVASQAQKAKEAGEALDALLTDYMDSPVLEQVFEEVGFPTWLLGKEKCDAALRAIVEKSPHRGVKAAALFSIALGGIYSHPPDEKSKSEGREILRRLVKEYADTRYAERAEGYLFQMDNLQVGMTAPDFEATDQDGKKFKLSDYRGKVVLIEFWGFW